jgi:hypothetical protein
LLKAEKKAWVGGDLEWQLKKGNKGIDELHSQSSSGYKQIYKRKTNKMWPVSEE